MYTGNERGSGWGVTFLYTGVPMQPLDPYPFSYKIYEKDILSLTKFAKTATSLTSIGSGGKAGKGKV